MKRPIDRRAALMIAGAAAVAAAAGPVAAQPTEISGTVTFHGALIPQGHLEIYLENRAVQDSSRRRVARTSTISDGGSKAIAFSLSPPASSTASATLQIVARLERADGWLLARGSAPYAAGSPVTITLNTVMY